MSTSPTTRQEVRAATRTIRRAAAVAAATELFAARGFHATQMTDVARQAGISLKVLYEAFPGKDELFAAVLEDVGDRFAGVMDVSQDEPPDRVLVDVIDRLVHLTAGNLDALRLYSRGADGIPVTLRDKGVDPFAPFSGRLCALLAGLIEAVQSERGTGRLDAELTARSLLALVIAEARTRLDAGGDVAAVAPDLRPLIEAIVSSC